MMGNNTFQLFEKRGISILKFSNSLSKSTNDCLNSSQLFFNSSAILLDIYDFTTSPYNIRAVRIIKSESKLEYAPERTSPNAVFELGQYASRIAIVISDLRNAFPPLLNLTNISRASSWFISVILVYLISFSSKIFLYRVCKIFLA